MYRGQPDQLLDLNWNQTMDASGHFESPLSSVVSSSQPSSSATSADGVAFHKLIGGFQGIDDSGNGMPLPLLPFGARFSSPAKLNLSMLDHFHPHQQQGLGIPMPLPHLDHFSGFNGRNHGHLATQFGVLEADKMPKEASFQIGPPRDRKETSVAGGLQLDINNGELVNAREESSVSDPAASGDASFGHPAGGNPKKRRAPPKGKVKENSLANSSADLSKVKEKEKK